MNRTIGISGFYISIALLILLVESLVRLAAPVLSENIAHIEKIPGIAQEFVSENKNAKETVLFLGNSLIDHAVNLDQLGAEDSSKVSVFKVVPDGTSLWDWYCIVKNQFFDSAHSPQTMVIGYAWGQVPPVPSRLAGYFCGVADLPDLYKLGMKQTSDILEYLAASVSKLYAMRETIRKRILDLIIPYYRESAREVNEANKKRKSGNPISNIPLQGSHLMNRFLELLHQRDIRLIFIAMPVIKDYPLNEELVRTVRNSNGMVYDYRHLEGINDSMFLDPIHLNDQGSRVFTKRLAADISRDLGL